MNDSATHDDDEVHLVRLAASGDVAAFEALYRANVARVHALCLRMLGDREAAEELTQDVFVRAWERLGSFRGESRFATWLHRVAVNAALDALRKRARWRERFATSPDPDVLVEAPSIGPRTGDADLERAIAALPPRARSVFVLHDIEGHAHREIAALTGTAVGTSKAHLHRARRLLREALSR